MNPTLINPYDFQKMINQYASDVRLLWDPKTERFRVFQTVAPVIELIGTASTRELRQNKLKPMFTIQYDDGSYRDPDESDLARVIQAIDSTIDLNIKGADHFADELERADDAREASIAPGVKDAMEWGAQEMYKVRTRKGILGF